MLRTFQNQTKRPLSLNPCDSPPGRLIRQQQNAKLILHIRNKLGTKFELKLTILIFWTKLTPQKYFQFKIEENKNYHLILHIRICLGSKFQIQ